MKTRIIALMLMFAGPIEAEIYRCDDPAGRPRFSDQPCGELIKVKPQTAGVYLGADGDFSAVSAANDARSRERYRQQLIREHNRNIEALQGARDGRLAAQRASSATARNNLAGAQYREALATEMAAVSQDYNARIATEREIIRDLIRQ